MITVVLQPIGRAFLSGLATMGRLTLFTLTALLHCLRPPYYWRLLLRQMVDIGYYSLPVVGMTAIFTGMVLALQSSTGFERFTGGETEQIDALTTLSTNPLNYLVAPRLIAGITMLPLLVAVGDVVGVFGGYLVSIY